MKSILALVSFILFSSVLNAQAYEGTVQFDKKKQPAILVEYVYPAQAVENAFVQKMEMLGFRPKEEKGILNRDRGFLVFRNAIVTDISEKRYDYILKVERKSRREDDESVLYLVVQDNGDNVLNKMDASDVSRAKSYLNAMIPDIEAANLELQILAQQDVVNKAEKKLRDLEEEYNTLTKKLKDNEKSQEDTRSDIENQKKSLEKLQEKRTKTDQ